jgi:plasmid replication initiation protein
MGNDLVRAAHNLKLIEKRLLMLAISRIDSKVADSGRNQTISLTVKDYLNEYETDRTSTYRELAKALDVLDGTRVKFKDEAIGDHGTIHWTTGVRYKGEGSFVISINGDLLPYLHDLKSHFTTYKLHRVSGLKSGYSWRLFELLMQFKGTGVLNISIDDFNHALETPDSLRANFANLRGRVIEPAIKEIANKDGLKVAYEPIKAGRKVKALKFTFQAEKPETKSKPSTYRPIPPDTELETIDKPMTKVEARQLEASVMATVHPMLKPVAKITKEQAEQEFSALSKLASDIGSTVEKLSSVQQKEAFKEYGFLK